MTAVTANSAIVATARAEGARGSAAQRPLFARIWEAFVRARLRQAEREIALRQHLLPQQLNAVGNGLDSRSEKDLPFVR